MKAEELTVDEYYDEAPNEKSGLRRVSSHVGYKYLGVRVVRRGEARHYFLDRRGITVWLNPEDMRPATVKQPADEPNGGTK